MAYRSADLLRLVQDTHTSEVAALEDEISAASVGGAERALARLVETALKAWTLAFGGPGRPARAGEQLRRLLAAARAAVRRILDGLGVRAAAALTPRLGESVALGAQQGAAFVAAAAGRRVRVPSVSQVSPSQCGCKAPGPPGGDMMGEAWNKTTAMAKLGDEVEAIVGSAIGSAHLNRLLSDASPWAAEILALLGESLNAAAAQLDAARAEIARLEQERDEGCAG